ncbi:MAG: hypothetical protein Kow00107_02010 [Planctomycetota bacterium]
MNKKFFFVVVSLFCFVAVAFLSTKTRAELPNVTVSLPPISLPTFSKLTFPQRSFPSPPQISKPPLPSITNLTTPSQAPIVVPEFDWFSWWHINVSYLLTMRDEGLFYREVQVGPQNVTEILSLLDYSGVFYPMTRSIAVQCLEKLDTQGIEQLRIIASGKWDGKGNVHPMISERKLQGLAAFALGLLRSRESLEDIVALTKDPRPDVRILAVLGLGHMGIDEAEDYLLQLIPDERDNRVAAAGMIALALTGSERSRKFLLETSDSSRSNPTRQAMSFLALSLIMNKPSLADINRASFSAEPNLWLSGIVAKAALLADKLPNEREVDKLISLTLLHAEGISNTSAILPLYLLKEKLGASKLLSLVENADPEVRALGRFLAALSGSPELTEAVVGKAADPDPTASYLQSLALAYLSAPDRARFAEQLLDDKEPIAKIAGILALGDYMEKADITKLKQVLAANTSFEFKFASLLAYARASERDNNAWNELVRNLRNSNRLVQDLSMVLIGATKSLKAARLLLDLKGQDVDELPFSIAMSLLGPMPFDLTLRNAIETKGDIPRASAVLAYSFLPMESAWARLFEVLDSDSVTLARAHAAAGIMRHPWRPASDNQVRILVNAAEKGPDSWVRGYSTLALGKYASHKDAGLALERLMDNPNVDIKAMAAFSAGIHNYPKGVQILKELIEKEKSYAVFAQIISLGMFKHRMFVPYFGSGIKYSSSDHERLAFAAALSASIEPGDYPEIIDRLQNANSVDKRTYAWTLALHDYPGLFLARKVVDALKQAKPDNDEVTKFHLALARCSLGDGLAAKDLLEAASSNGFSYHQIIPEPRFLLEYVQQELPDYCHIIPYFNLD